jgi:hypothetical protein
LRKLSLTWLAQEAHNAADEEVSMKTKSLTLLNLLVVTVLCVAFRASAIPITNIVNNGGFETGDFTGWTQSNTPGTGVGIFAPHSGTYAAFFGNSGSLTYLSQDLSTVAGTNYELSFFLQHGGGGSGPAFADGEAIFNQLQVFWNGYLIYDQTNLGAFPYTEFTFNLLATDPTTELKFGFRNDTSIFDIDDIAVGLPAGTAVPEVFSTLWLALPLLLMFGFAGRAGRKFQLRPA